MEKKIVAQGKNIKEQLNNWHSSHKTQVSTTFVGMTKENMAARFMWTKTDDKDSPQVTQRELEELQVLESLVTSTQR